MLTLRFAALVVAKTVEEDRTGFSISGCDMHADEDFDAT